MKQHFNCILLAQGLVLAATGVFAGSSPMANDHLNNHGIFKMERPGMILRHHPFRDTTNELKTAPVKTVLTESRVSFNAAFMSHSIDLHWNTGNSKLYNHFYIERSVDGLNYERVGEVNGDAAAPETHDYNYTDNVKASMARKNDLYYRLLQIDGADKSDYSKVLIVRTYNTRSVAAVSVTPDPAVNDILVNVQLKENSFVVMTVKDEKGNQVMKKITKADTGANSFSLDGTSRLKAGSYLLEVIINSNERMTMQLIKS